MKAIFIIMPIAMLAMLAASPAMAIYDCGDVNCMDGVDPGDIVELRNRVRALVPLDCEWAGDVNCMDGVDPGDIVMLRNRVRALVPLDCCICEVFAEWVNNYSALPNYGNLLYSDVNAQGFYTELCGDTYWDGGGFYGDNDSWEVDFKDPIHGGTDIADNAEFAFFSGHGRRTSGGDLAAFIFNSTTNDHYLTCEDALWGNTKLNWIAIDACQVLNHNTRENWQSAFEELHSICGFDTHCTDNATRGGIFAKYMDGTWAEWEIIIAWAQATYETEPTIHYGAAYAADADGDINTVDCWDDHLYSHGPSVEPPANPEYFWYARWECGIE